MRVSYSLTGVVGAQDVSVATEGLDKVSGVAVINFAAQAGDVNLNDVAEFFPVVIVEMLEQFGLRDHDALAVHEIFEDAIFHGSERKFTAGAADGAPGGIHFKIVDAENGGGLAFAAADDGFGAREKFAEIERLGDVIVGAGVQESDDGIAIVFGGEDEDGSDAAFGAKSFHNVEAAAFGKHEVQNDEVVGDRTGEKNCVVAIGGVVNGVTSAVAQSARDIFGEPLFVFHDKNAHRGLRGDILSR